MTEIHEYNMALLSVNRKTEAVPLSSVVSLGTGLIPVTELKEIDVFRPDSIWDTAKLAYGISAIGNLLVDQATVSYPLYHANQKRLRTTCFAAGGRKSR